jgi:alkyl sulfatase BDS1-like metallo-beta-lactamase superfamily hydrolase
MAIYASADQLNALVRELFEGIFNDEIVGPKLRKSKLVIRYDVSDPDTTVWVDTTKSRVAFGDYEHPASIQLAMNGDTFHAFMSKNATIPDLVAKKEVKVIGSLAKVMKLLPLVKKAYEDYPRIAKTHNVRVE